jgi:AcrR family transcriptional regulator
MAVETRDRILATSVELMRRQGYNATGIKAIVTEADATLGSLYHYFPGGKLQLADEAIRASGAQYEKLIPAVIDAAPDIVTGVRWFFAGAAAHLVETNYADACPIATIALEVSSQNDILRQACAEVFENWIAAGAARMPIERRRDLAIGFLCALEGAFVLARALRTTEPLQIAGEMVARRVEEAIASA